jgi:hypothetical protein
VKGWRAYAEATPLEAPESLRRRKIAALCTRAAADYDRRRRVWHANMPTIKTAQLLELHKTLCQFIDVNLQFGDPDGIQLGGREAIYL